MKLNISYPANGTQKLIEIEDERKLRVFMDRRMGQEVQGDSVGPEFKGYVFKITGGNDKQGFPMKQGIMHPTRVRLLLSDGHSCYRPRRTGERKRKSVRGCIVAMDLSVLALSVVKQGDEELPGLTDKVLPKRLGPKRATKIRRFFGLSKQDDVSIFCIAGGWQPLGLILDTNAFVSYRSASSSSVVKSSPKAKARNHTPRPPASSVSSLLNVSNTSVTAWLLSVVKLRLPRMLRYVYIYRCSWEGLGLIMALQNEYAQILAKRVNEEKAKKTELRSELPLILAVGKHVLTRTQNEERRQ